MDGPDTPVAPRPAWTRVALAAFGLGAGLFIGLYLFALASWACQLAGRLDWALAMARRTFPFVISDGELADVHHQAELFEHRERRQWGAFRFEWDRRDLPASRIEQALPLWNEIYAGHRAFFGRAPRRITVRLASQMHGAEGQFDTLTLHLLASKLEDRELLLHEMSHVFLTDLLLNPGYAASCPAWLDEGLAEWLTVRSARSSEYRDYPVLKAQGPVALDRLGQTVLQGKSYWPAYTLVDDLLGVTGEEGLRCLLDLLRRGVLFERAFTVVSGRRTWRFVEEWADRFARTRVEAGLDADRALERARFFLERGSSYQTRLYLDRVAKGGDPRAVALVKARLLELEGDQATGRVRRNGYRSAQVLVTRLRSAGDPGARLAGMAARLEQKLVACDRETVQAPAPATTPARSSVPQRDPSLLGFLVAVLALAAAVWADRLAGRRLSSASSSLESWARRHPRLLYLAFTVPMFYLLQACGGAGLEYGQGFYFERDLYSMEAGRQLALASLPVVLGFGLWVLSGPVTPGCSPAWALVPVAAHGAFCCALAALGLVTVWPDRSPFGPWLLVDAWLAIVLSRVLARVLFELLEGEGPARAVTLALLFDLFWVGLAPDVLVHVGGAFLGLAVVVVARTRTVEAAAGLMAGAQLAGAVFWASAPSLGTAGLFIPVRLPGWGLGGLWGPFAGAPALWTGAIVLVLAFALGRSRPGGSGPGLGASDRGTR